MQAQRFIEENYADRDQCVDELATRSLLSRRNFEKAFQKSNSAFPRGIYAVFKKLR